MTEHSRDLRLLVLFVVISLLITGFASGRSRAGACSVGLPDQSGCNPGLCWPGLVSESQRRDSASRHALEKAVEVLSESCAQLEHAKALVDLGAAYRRVAQASEAKNLLEQGADLADQCDAQPAIDEAFRQLHQLGAKPRCTRITGIEALTPSELRVADLAATGQSNREIAQKLYVTPKPSKSTLRTSTADPRFAHGET